MTEKKEKKKSNIKSWILFALILAVFAAGFFFLPTFHFYVEGNETISDEEVVNLLFPQRKDRTYRNVLIQAGTPVKTDVFESASVKPKGFFSAEITVTEAEGAFTVNGGAEKMVFNVNGVRIPDRDERELPVLEGITVRSCELYKSPDLPEESGKLFRSAGEVFKIIHTLKVPVSVLTVSENDYLLTFGAVHVNLGENRYMLEKITEVSAQYRKYEGLKGTLHMENYNGKNGASGFYFTVE